MKKAEAGLKSLSLFGKIASLNGKDYFVAEGKGKAYYFDNKLVAETKFFYTQDCVKWLDLNTVDEETAKRCDTIHTTMSGDPSKVYTVTEPATPWSWRQMHNGMAEQTLDLIVRCGVVKIVRQPIADTSGGKMLSEARK